MPCFSPKRRFVRHYRFVSYANGESSDTTDLSHMQTASRQTPPICLTYKRRVLRHHRFVCYASQEACQSGSAVAKHQRETVHRLCFSFFSERSKTTLDSLLIRATCCERGCKRVAILVPGEPNVIKQMEEKPSAQL